MSLVMFGVLLTWLLVALGCWLGYQLIRQNGRILLRLERLEERLGPPGALPASASSPLPAGSVAPDFELPDLTGGRKALSEFRGRRVLLIFFHPRCGFCARMAPDLTALPIDGEGGHPVPLVIAAGTAAENHELVREHGLRCPVLLQGEMPIAAAYGAHGTPIGYLIDEEGRIAGEPAAGAQAVLALAGRPGATAENGGDSPTARPSSYRGNRSLAESHINRSGLPPGTPAPPFRLTELEGGEVSLRAYRGRPLLLVFSNPNCGPCDQLAPELEQRSRRTPGVPVVMISRGEPEANRAKVREFGLTFPVALQRQWEISRLYGMFATPIAYLINAEGVIAADVAVGVEPILALHAGASGAANGRTALRREKTVVPP